MLNCWCPGTRTRCRADRVWLAALARLIPCCRWAEVFPICAATLLGWHRRLAAKKYDTSRQRAPDRPPARTGIERFVLRLPKEDPCGGTVGSTANWRNSV
jgi:putative transposase